jgi:hypothetical protein
LLLAQASDVKLDFAGKGHKYGLTLTQFSDCGKPDFSRKKTDEKAFAYQAI